jgi:hypothetical protein
LAAALAVYGLGLVLRPPLNERELEVMRGMLRRRAGRGKAVPSAAELPARAPAE